MPSQSDAPETIYTYRTADGTPVYQVIRFPEKQFRIRKIEADGNFTWNLEGVQRIPYRLEEVALADTVYFVEGEKDVETLRKLELVASTNAGGCNGWKPDLARHFTNKTVIIIRDQDDPGAKWADRVTADMRAAGAKVQRIDSLPGLAPDSGQDVTDWINAGHTKQELLEVIETARKTQWAKPKPAVIPSPPPAKQPHSVDAERTLLGAILTNNGHWLAPEKYHLKSDQFFVQQHRLIFEAMQQMITENLPIDTITLADVLRQQNRLDVAGGVAYLEMLQDGMPAVLNSDHYARIVREKWELRDFLRAQLRWERAAQDGLIAPADLRAQMEMYLKASVNGNGKPKLRGVDFLDFLQMDLRPIEYIAAPAIPMQGIVMVFGKRGIAKTFLAMTVAYSVACGLNRVFEWAIPGQRRNVYVDGEMAANVLQDRFKRLQRGIGNYVPTADQLVLITPDVAGGRPNIASSEGQRLIEEYLQEGTLLWLDNLSCLSRGSGKENEAESWDVVQEWLLDLRQKRITTVFLHHAGKSGTQRGTGKREDTLDTIIELRQPSDYVAAEGARLEVHYDKVRIGPGGDQFYPFELRLEEGFHGGVEWTIKPLRDVMETRAFQMFDAKMNARDVQEELKISRFQAYRLKKKWDNRGSE